MEVSWDSRIVSCPTLIRTQILLGLIILSYYKFDNTDNMLKIPFVFIVLYLFLLSKSSTFHITGNRRLRIKNGINYFFFFLK